MGKGPDPIKLIFKGLKAASRANKKAAREELRRQKVVIREEAKWLREQEKQMNGLERQEAKRRRELASMKKRHVRQGALLQRQREKSQLKAGNQAVKESLETAKQDYELRCDNRRYLCQKFVNQETK